VPSNPCHRDKSYGNSNKNWNKNDPVSPPETRLQIATQQKIKILSTAQHCIVITT
jgi:hypothetical protein